MWSTWEQQTESAHYQEMALVSLWSEKQDIVKKEVWSSPPVNGVLEPGSLFRLSYLTLSLHRLQLWNSWDSKPSRFLSLLLDTNPLSPAPDPPPQSIWTVLEPPLQRRFMPGGVENERIPLYESYNPDARARTSSSPSSFSPRGQNQEPSTWSLGWTGCAPATHFLLVTSLKLKFTQNCWKHILKLSFSRHNMASRWKPCWRLWDIEHDDRTERRPVRRGRVDAAHDLRWLDQAECLRLPGEGQRSGAEKYPGPARRLAQHWRGMAVWPWEVQLWHRLGSPHQTNYGRLFHNLCRR